jgi:hypothetical protein
LTMCNTVGLFADCDAFGAVKHFTSFIWAFNFTFWFFTFYVADSIFWFST